VGQAIQLNGTSQYVLLDAATQYPKTGKNGGLETGFTITAWVKLGAFQAGDAFIGVRNAGTGYPALQFNERYVNGEGWVTCSATATMGGGTWIQPGTGAVENWYNDGKWHLIAIKAEAGTVAAGKGFRPSIDLDDNDSNLNYVLGSGETINAWQTPIAIGAYNNQGTVGNFFEGAIDNVRIFNYVLTQEELNTMYKERDGGYCEFPYASQYDFDNSCQVDLGDIVALATQWLNCGRDPIEACY
jgi:hypothetical protein